jgi:DNA adenine methylase
MDSFLKWVGGKRLLRKEIVKRIPHHHCYVEPFGGAAWVLFYKEKFACEVYNDLDGRLVNLFKCAKFHVEELQKELIFLLGSRQMFMEFKEQAGLTDIQKAGRFYFLNAISFGGKCESFGTSKLSGGGGYISKKNLIEDLEKASERLDRIVIENLDFADCVQKYNGEDTFFYCDPPYIHGANFKGFPFSMADHERLANVLKTVRGRWLLSLDDCKEAHDLYKRHRIERLERKTGINNYAPKNPVFKELLIRNR